MQSRTRNATSLRCQVADWLWGRDTHPDGLAFDVSTRLIRERVDIAAVWLTPGKTRSDVGESCFRMRSALFICCCCREDCWPECSNADEILKEIVLLRKEREEVQAQIRHDEPELREMDVLFEELAMWRYELSSNKRYSEIESRLGVLERCLYKGTRLEHLSGEPLAEQLYLAVTPGLITSDELREDWGLLWIGDKVEVVRKSRRHTPCEADRILLLRRVLASNAAGLRKVMSSPSASSAVTPKDKKKR